MVWPPLSSLVNPCFSPVLERTEGDMNNFLMCGFVVFQHKRLAVPIRLAGGTAHLKDPSTLDVDLTEDICLVEPEEQVDTKIDAILLMLRR